LRDPALSRQRRAPAAQHRRRRGRPNRAARDPAVGIGKPERLSHDLAGYWSRRITDEHRLVHQLRDDELIVVQARYRY
jgi:toxin YoeB